MSASRRFASRVGAVAFLTALIVRGLLTTGCSGWTEYTIVNETDQELLTWPMDVECDDSPDDRYDTLEPKAIKPHHSREYTSTSVLKPRCVLVTTGDRRPVLAEPYQEAATYRVTPPLEPYGSPVASWDELPEPSLWDNLRNAPLLVTIPVLLFAAAFVWVLSFTVVRFLNRRFRRKAS